MKVGKYPDDLRAQVLAALLAGQGVSATAREFGIDKATVSRWQKHLPAEKLQQVATEKAETLEALIFACLEANLQAQQSICEAIHEPEYLRIHSPSEIAVLYGVLADKADRRLDQLARAQEYASQHPA